MIKYIIKYVIFLSDTLRSLRVIQLRGWYTVQMYINVRSTWSDVHTVRNMGALFLIVKRTQHADRQIQTHFILVYFWILLTLQSKPLLCFVLPWARTLPLPPSVRQWISQAAAFTDGETEGQSPQQLVSGKTELSRNCSAAQWTVMIIWVRRRRQRRRNFSVWSL